MARRHYHSPYNTPRMRDVSLLWLRLSELTRAYSYTTERILEASFDQLEA